MTHNYSFVVLKYLFWNELTFLVTHDIKMNALSQKYKNTCFYEYSYGCIHNKKKSYKKMENGCQKNYSEVIKIKIKYFTTGSDLTFQK